MNNNMYFLALIIDALKQTNPEPLLEKAFSKIRQFNENQQYEEGLYQFQRFMTKVAKNWKPQKHEAAPRRPHIVIEYNNEHFDFVPIRKGFLRMPGVKPGLYAIRTSTGCLLWQGELAEKDLYWAQAFPERELELAAATEETSESEVVTKEINLLDGELIIRVSPGIETGYIVLITR